MPATVPYILIAVAALLAVIGMVIRRDFRNIGGICGVVAIILFIVAICILAFTGTAPHIVEDPNMPVSYP